MDKLWVGETSERKPNHQSFQSSTLSSTRQFLEPNFRAHMKTHFTNPSLRFATALCLLLIAAAHPTLGDVTFSGDTSNDGTDVIVGDTGIGSLTIDGGSSLSNSIGYVGNQADSFGSVTVSSGTWANSDSLTIGNSGTGSLTISGGTVSNTNGTLGNSAGSNGTATVSTGGAWTTTGDLFIGYGGNGNLAVSGGTVSNVNGVIGFIGEDVEGNIPGSNGIVTISGGNWTNSGSLTVGSGGNGTLAVSGGNVSNVNGVIGYNSSATISGGNWTNSGNLYIAANNSRLTIETGGLVTVSGTLTKTSTGIINLNAGGSLSIGVGGTTGELDSQGVFTNNGTVIFNRTANYRNSSALSGVGSLIKEGSNILTLLGNSTYSGATTINAGTLQIGEGGNEDASISNSSIIINNASLVFKNKTDRTHAAQISGSGTFEKRGTGKLTLIGNNTFNGTIQIFGAGGLQIGDGGTSGSLVSNVSGGSLVFNRSDSSTYGGVFSGSTLTKLWAGTLTLTGSNTYTGTTTISAGTLQIGAGGTSGGISNSSGITNNANLAFNRSDATSYTGAISGSGNLTQLGSGTLSLTGANTYTGTTTISAGTLQIGAGGTTGSLTSNITNNAALVFNRSDDTTYAGSISGNGAVTKSGAGTLTIIGNNTYTGATAISAGTLQIGSANALGSGGNITFGGGTLQFGSGFTTDVSSRLKNSVAAIQIDTDNNNITFASDVDATNTGGLTKLGSGNLTLTGNNTYTGGTTVNAGTLLVTGSTSSVIVNNSGTLGGNGTLGAVTINSGGTIAPGNSPGTIRVGNLTLNGGSIYNWQASSINGTAGTDWDLIASAGTLTLNATSGNPITISLSTLGSATLAGVKNASWQIGNFTSSINGFDASAFTFNSSNMTGTAGGYFMSLGSGNTTLLLNYKTAATWNTATGNWSTAAQWDGGSLPSNGDAIEFSGSGGVSTNNSFLNSASGLTFLAGAGSYTVNGSALTLLGEGIVNDSANTQTLALDLTLGANQTFATNTANLIVSGAISGNASLTKAGNKTLTLLGSNTYTGGTTVSSGILAGTTTGLQGAIANNAVVNFDQSFTGTYAGVMSGNGSLLKTGSGTVTISGTNSYTGGTQLDGGVLEALHANALGNGALTLSSGTLAVGNTANPNLVLSGMTDLVWLSSNAEISLAHGGNITISGNFSNGGNTGNRTLDFGTGQSLQLGNNTLVSFGATNFSASNFVAAISGSNSLSGSFQIIGNSLVYNLQGANVSGNVIDNSGAGATPTWVDFTVNGNTGNGTVITAGGNNTIRDLAFTNNGNLAIQAGYALSLSQGQVAVENGNSVVSGGTLATPGNFNKTGAGELDVQSTLSVNGTASIDAGLLSVNGNLTANSVAVNSGAILGGSGTIFAPVTVSGTLAPGNSPGTLSMASLALTPTAVTDIEIESLTNFDRLVVGGAATVDGTLNVIPYNGNPLAYGQQYSFLVASGGISGEFDTITAPATFRGRFLNLGTTGILLIAPDSYTQVAVTPNQQNVAKALDSFIAATSGDRETVSIALDLQTAEQFPSAFDQIMPGFYESLANIAIEQAFAQTQMLNQRISSVRLGAAGFQAIGGISQPLVHDKNGKSAAEAKDASPIVESATATNWNTWALGTGMFSRSTNLGSLQNYNNDAGGFLVGADYRWSENFVTGLYGGYDYSYAEYNGGGSTKGNSFSFGTYASYAKDGYYADAVIGGGYTRFQTKRSIQFSTIDRTASADPDSGQFTAGLNLGKDFEVGKFTLGPIVGAQYTYAGIGSFTESGAESLDLSLGQQNANSLRSTLGGRIAYTWNLNQKIALIPEVRMFWQHEFLNNPRNISASLDSGSGAAFDFETSDPYRDSVFAGAGVTAQFGERWNASLFYNVNFGSQTYQSNMVSAGLNFSF
jgi:autotransporter-associated beta strand protein/T5SS/PEP-CTERM-associated repeat protein